VPAQTDVAGNPLLPPIHLSGTTPEGWGAPDFLRLFSARQIRAQIVFTPREVWTLPRKQGGGKLLGVAARVEAILLTHARTGEVLGLWFAPEAAPVGGAPRKGAKK
jgi:hypothetical protein